VVALLGGVIGPGWGGGFRVPPCADCKCVCVRACVFVCMCEGLCLCVYSCVNA